MLTVETAGLHSPGVEGLFVGRAVVGLSGRRVVVGPTQEVVASDGCLVVIVGALVLAVVVSGGT